MPTYRVHMFCWAPRLVPHFDHSAKEVAMKWFSKKKKNIQEKVLRLVMGQLYEVERSFVFSAVFWFSVLIKLASTTLWV